MLVGLHQAVSHTMLARGFVYDDFLEVSGEAWSMQQARNRHERVAHDAGVEFSDKQDVRLLLSTSQHIIERDEELVATNRLATGLKLARQREDG